MHGRNIKVVFAGAGAGQCVRRLYGEFAWNTPLYEAGGPAGPILMFDFEDQDQVLDGEPLHPHLYALLEDDPDASVMADLLRGVDGVVFIVDAIGLDVSRRSFATLSSALDAIGLSWDCVGLTILVSGTGGDRARFDDASALIEGGQAVDEDAVDAATEPGSGGRYIALRLLIDEICERASAGALQHPSDEFT